jgi:hypothetical protein
MAEIEELLDVSSSPFLLFLSARSTRSKECAEISYFDIDLKNNTMVLWTDNLFSDTVCGVSTNKTIICFIAANIQRT